MLVLTGALPDRSQPRPAAVTDVLGPRWRDRGPPRIGTDEVEPAAVSGSAVADLAHLVAELVENGALLPARDAVRVTGMPDPDAPGYRRIADRGVGMTAAALEAAAGPDPGVGCAGIAAGGEADRPGRRRAPRRPARDHRELESRPGGGVLATVTIPDRLLVPLADLPAPRRP